MRLVELQDAVRRHYDLEAQPQVFPPSGVVLTQPVGDLFAAIPYCLRTSVAAAGGEYQAIGLHNPAGSGVDVELTQAHIVNVGATIIYHGVSTSTTMTDRGSGYALDMRTVPRGGYRSAAKLYDESNVAQLLVAQGELHAVAAGDPIEWDCSVFVEPGYTYVFMTAAVNGGLRGTLVWRETLRGQRP